jgi:hypothetical protein
LYVIVAAVSSGAVTPPLLYNHLHNQYDHRPSLPPPPLPRVNPVLPTGGHAVTRRDRPLATTITPANNRNNMRGRSRSQPPPLRHHHAMCRPITIKRKRKFVPFG